jgi:hypothetical protein
MGFFYFLYSNGSVNSPSDGTSGDCKLDTKPQPQWIGNWLGGQTEVDTMIGQNDYDEDH